MIAAGMLFVSRKNSCSSVACPWVEVCEVLGSCVCRELGENRCGV